MELLKFVETFDVDEGTAKDVNQSQLNIMFSIAKTYSKLFSPEIDERVEYLKSSLMFYERIAGFLDQIKKSPYGSSIVDIDEHIRVSDEMVRMLPIRISQVNAGRGE